MVHDIEQTFTIPIQITHNQSVPEMNVKKYILKITSPKIERSKVLPQYLTSILRSEMNSDNSKINNAIKLKAKNT
jgi:hypothetical protein